jgi:hypothetical protein
LSRWRRDKDLATVPPRNKNSEEKVEPAEASGKKPCAPGRGTINGKAAEHHETNSHDWNGGHGKCAAGDDARPIKQQPRGWQGRSQAYPEERESEKRAGDQRGEKSEGHFTAGTGEDRKATAVGFPENREQRDGDGEQTFSQPDSQPSESRRLAGSKPGGAESGQTQNYLSPARDGGESGGALHGVADEAQIVDGVSIGRTRGQRPSFAAKMSEAVLAGLKHRTRIAGTGMRVKYF